MRFLASQTPVAWGESVKELFAFIGRISLSEQQALVREGLVVSVNAEVPLQVFQRLRRGRRPTVRIRLDQRSEEQTLGPASGWSVTLITTALADGEAAQSRTSVTVRVPNLELCCEPAGKTPR
jgi:hypothetical protein